MEISKGSKLSFKRHKRERGLAAVGNSRPNVDIKADRKIVGYISAPNWQTKDNLYRIRLTLKKTQEEMADPKGNANCPWRWATLKATHGTEELARTWLEENWPMIDKNFDLWCNE